MVEEGPDLSQVRREIDVPFAGVGAIQEPFQFIQEIIVLILQGLALGETVLGVD